MENLHDPASKELERYMHTDVFEVRDTSQDTDGVVIRPIWPKKVGAAEGKVRPINVGEAERKIEISDIRVLLVADHAQRGR